MDDVLNPLIKVCLNIFSWYNKFLFSKEFNLIFIFFLKQIFFVGHHGDDPDSMSPTIAMDADDSENEEAILSGFGDVSKECSGSELDSWSQVLQG